MSNGNEYQFNQWLQSNVEDNQSHVAPIGLQTGATDGSDVNNFYNNNSYGDNSDLTRSPEAIIRKSINQNTGSKIVKHIRGGSKSMKTHSRFMS